GTTNQQISIPELRRILSEQNSKEWEKQLSEKHIEDVDRKTLRSFVRHSNAEERIRFPYQNARTTLEKLKLIKNDQLLKAGEVLFCNDNTLEIQAAVFAGTDKLTFLDIRQIRGNMFDAEVKCRAYIMDHIDWRGLLAGDGRKEIPEIPIRALEEALVNSMAHRDYTTLKSNEIAVYKDRIEIYNPGIYLPTASPEQYVKGNEQSVQRNPLIADTLYLAGVIEKWGSGFKRMVDECEKAGVRVEFKKVETGFVVVFYRQKNGIESNQVPEKIPESTGKVPEKYQKIITVIVSEPEISRENLSEKTGLSAGTILSRLRWLMKKGLLRRVGPDKGGHWEIIKKP
ncbi:MAG: ATP-binding protein, partial [Candidatus Micrarchaeota archaeon]